MHRRTLILAALAAGTTSAARAQGGMVFSSDAQTGSLGGGMVGRVGSIIPSFPPGPAKHPEHFKTKHVLEASLRDRRLSYYRVKGGSISPVVAYNATVPPGNDLKGPLMVGRVTGIQRRPSWCPTVSMGDRACYHHGQPGNPMGQVAKFIISGFGYRRIHGNEPGRSPYTAGCVSIQDGHMRDLLAHLGSRAVGEGITVIFTES